jgi:3' terminal RNA ribose 2'-O-methyltransferase Hen1
MSVAIAQVFSSALGGRCKDRPELVHRPLSLEAQLDVLPARGGGEDIIRRLFEPLGYEIELANQPLDSKFNWGESPYYSVVLRSSRPLHQLLNHLYVLIPVLDNDKHYWVGDDEVEKLLSRGGEWLKQHPEKELIASRYLRYQRSLTRDALASLTVEDATDPDASVEKHDQQEAAIEHPLSLNDQRHATVVAVLKASNAKRVLDLGCAQGKLIRRLLDEKQFELIVGLDVSLRALEHAESRLNLDRLPDRQRERVQLLHGSLMYRDARIRDFDAACLIEVIEHLDPPRLAAMERSVFEFARPKTVIVTTPNVEYNVRFASLPAGSYRHKDHRFEWTREAFRQWTTYIAERFGYAVRLLPIGAEDAEVGSATQMGVFER